MNKAVKLAVKKAIRSVRYCPWKSLWILTLASAGVPSGEAIAWVAEKEGAETFRFKADGNSSTTEYKAPFVDASFIAFLGGKGGSGSPFALLKGRTCANCTTEQQSYFLVNVKPKSKLYSMIQPGRIVDSKKGMTVYESRAFYGRCLNDEREGYFVFQREHVNKRRGYQKSVYMATVTETQSNAASEGTELTENLIDGKRHLPNIDVAVRRVRAKECFELPRQSRSMMKTAFNLGPKRVGMKEDDDDKFEKEAEKEAIKRNPEVVDEEAARSAASVPTGGTGITD